MKVWTSSQQGDDKLIAFVNQTIFKGNSKLVNVDKVIFELKTLKTPPKDLFEVPLSYIKEIKLQEGKKHIELVFGKDSSEDLRISDEKERYEIFEYLKANISNAEYMLVKTSPIQAGKKPLIAFGVVTGLFLWTLYIALGIESGNEYDVSGQHYNSIAGIVLAIASIGVRNVILVFGFLILIAIISFIKKAMNPPVVNRLVLLR